MTTAPLWTVADCRPSNVDKKSVEGQDRVRLCNYTDVYKNQHIEASMDLMEATAPADQIERFQVLPGDVLITKDSESNEDIGVPALVRTAEPGMVCGYHLTLLRPDPDHLHPSYLYWLLESQPVKDYWRTNSFGVTRFSLVSPTVWRLPVPLPHVEVQRRLAEFLDRELAEIDAMDAELNHLIQTLQERKVAAISAPWSSPESDSWEIRPLWSMFRRDKVLGFTNEPMVSVFREHGVVFKDDHSNLNVTAQDRSIYQLIEPGWLVINRMKAWQGSVGISPIRGITSGHYICFRPLHDEDPSYLNWMFRSPRFRDWFAAYSRGVRPGQAEIDNSYLDGMPVLVPPLAQQRRIAAELDHQTARIDDMIADANQLKTLLAERRSTLITDVVTGKKEVPA